MPVSLIVSAVALVIVIIITIRIYPLLLIIFSRLFFGKYSAKHLLLHKKYMGTSPYGYCIKDDFINHLAGFYKIPDDRKIFQTNKNIVFGTTKFGEKFSQIIMFNKKLFCLNAIRLPQFELKVVGFRSEMFDFEMKTYYYFANNRFFMGEYSFKLPDDEKIDEILSILQKKYLDSEKVSEMDFLIENKNQAIIFYEHNGFHLSIKYLTQEDKKILSVLNDYWESNIRVNIIKSGSFKSDLMSKL